MPIAKIGTNLTPQEKEVYLSIKAVRRKSGISCKLLRDAFPNINRPRMSDILRHLIQKNMIYITISMEYHNKS